MDNNHLPKYHSSVFFVSDIEKSKKFYVRTIGQKIEMDFGRCVGFIGGFSIWERSYAHKMIGLKEEDTLINKKDAELYFEIQELDALFTKLKNEKIIFVHDIIEQPWAQRCFRIYDPDKHIIEFAEPMAMVIERLYNEGLSHNQIVKKSLMPVEIVLDVIGKIDSVKNDRFTEDLIAACGMNCGICMAFLREKNSCHGCRQAHLNKAKTRVVCKIKNCENLKAVNGSFCYECTIFPCKRLKHLDNRYTSKYHMSMLENLVMIKNQGMKTFLEHQQKQWTCSTCGTTICCHNGLCYQCQRDEVKARRNRLGWVTDAEKQIKKKK